MTSSSVLDYERAYEYLEHHARVQPEAEAIISGAERWTYAELRHRVDECARGLLAMGIQPGERIAYILPPCPTFVVVLLAVQAVGAIAVGVNPKYRRREVAHILNDATPVLLFAQESERAATTIAELVEEVTLLPNSCRLVVVNHERGDRGSWGWADLLWFSRQLPDQDVDVFAAATDPDAPSFIIYTSGTTGAPKGALLKQSAAIRHGKQILGIFTPQPLRVINYYPTNHVSGVVANTLYTLLAGGTQVCLERFDPGAVLSIIEKEGITQWGGIPTMFQLCLAHERFSSTDLSSVQLLSWGGSAASPALIRDLGRRVPRMSTLYALTETTGAVTVLPPTNDVDMLTRTVGTPLPDTEVRIVDDDDREVAEGEVGEMQVRGDCVMIGYWQNPSATTASIAEDGWLRTGDLAKLADDGLIEIMGRKNSMYKSGGYNVYPKEVEDVLEAHDQIDIAVVVGAVDPLYGEVGIAFVCASRGGDTLNQEVIQDFCRSQLANYKVPKKIFIEQELPILPGGKVDRSALQRRAESL